MPPPLFEALSIFGSEESAITVCELLIRSIVPPMKTETTPIVNLRIDHLCL